MIGKCNPTIGYVPSCADPERGYFQAQQTYYARYGIQTPVYFELDGEHPQDSPGLHLVDFAFVPHVEHIALSTLQAYSRQHRVTLYGCRDGDGIVVENDRVTCMGDVVRIVDGELLPTGVEGTVTGAVP